jgi:glutathione S-transferase
MIVVHHAPKARSVRVVWLLEELGVPFQVKPVALSRETLQSDAHLKVHPLGKVPAIQDGDLTMFESGAIVEYLIERYANGRLAPPPAAPARAQYLQWLHFGEATCLPPLSDLVQHSFLRPEAERIPAMVPDARARVVQWMDVLDRALATRPYVAGEEFTAADVMIGYAVALAKLLQLVGPDHPKVAAYLARLEARPAFQKAFD